MTREHDKSNHINSLPGFDEARRLLWGYEARARVHQRLALTSFVENPTVLAVHVDNTSRADRVQLTAFDRDGVMAGSDTLYVDEFHQRLDLTPEFDHEWTRLQVPPDSDLEQRIAREDGWVIDLAVLRQYHRAEDMQTTERAAFLAMLGDLMATGQAKGFIMGAFGLGGDDADGPGSSGAA